MTGSNNGALSWTRYSFRDDHYTIREYIRNFIMSKLETNTIDTLSGTTNLTIGSY